MNKRKPTRYERAVAAEVLGRPAADLVSSAVAGSSFKDAARSFVSAITRATVELIAWNAIAAELGKRFGGRRRRRGKLLRGQRARRPR